jgi:predicted Zn-dependent protease
MPAANSGTKSAPSVEFTRRLDEALKLKARQRYAEAKKILLALAKEDGHSAPVFGVLGDVYWRLGLLNDASQSFARACALSPTSELASLGLFHTLWEAGQTGPAIDEMTRFLSISHSSEYAKLLGELVLGSGSRAPGRTRAGRHGAAGKSGKKARPGGARQSIKAGK